MKQNFWTELGLDCIDLVVLLDEIEKKFGVKIAPKDMEDIKTIEGLSNLILEQLQQV